jgi:hypothetical protein
VGTPLARSLGPFLTFLLFVSPMLASIVLGAFGAGGTVEFYLALLSLLAFAIATVQVVIALFKRSLRKLATWTLIILANIVLFTSDSVAHLQDMAYLYIHRDHYRAVIAAKRTQPDYPGFVMFETASSFDAMEEIIFDETDSLATYPLPATSPLLSESVFVQCRYSARYLFDHFYSVDIGC